MTVESRDAFVFVAACAYVDHLGPVRDAAIVALRPRDPDVALFTLARGEGTVTFDGHAVRFRVEVSDPVATDTKPEPYRELRLETAGEREVLVRLVSSAIERHRRRVTEPRGLRGSAGVMRFVWDADAQTWDAGKLVPRRPLDTLFLPDGTADDALIDLLTYLRPDTRSTYAAMHVSPVRVYLLHGHMGAGKSSLIHCLASETGHNLAVMSFAPHTSDEDLRASLHAMPPSCFLCLEDVDCLFDKRATKNHGVNFSSFLSALDGSFTSCTHDAPLTVFLTTNFMDKLDPALRRRVDYAVEFGPATRKQCQRMFSAFYPSARTGTFETVWASVSRYAFATSVFQKFLVRSMPLGDPVRCLDMFGDLVTCTYGVPNCPDATMYS